MVSPGETHWKQQKVSRNEIIAEKFVLEFEMAFLQV
jgi:hypothetical protein